MHEKSLANLRPARKGEIRNASGRNQWTADRERRERFQAICRALNRCADPDLEQRLVESLARQMIEGALLGDPRLLLQIVERILGPLEYEGARRHQSNWARRQSTAAGSSHQEGTQAAPSPRPTR